MQIQSYWNIESFQNTHAEIQFEAKSKNTHNFGLMKDLLLWRYPYKNILQRSPLEEHVKSMKYEPHTINDVYIQAPIMNADEVGGLSWNASLISGRVTVWHRWSWTMITCNDKTEKCGIVKKDINMEKCLPVIHNGCRRQAIFVVTNIHDAIHHCK